MLVELVAYFIGTAIATSDLGQSISIDVTRKRLLLLLNILVQPYNASDWGD